MLPASRLGPSAHKPDGIRARRNRSIGAALPVFCGVFQAPSLSGHGKYSAAGAGVQWRGAGRPMMEVLTQPSPKGNPMNEEQLSAEIESMLAIQTALITLVGALIRTHHDETNLQMSIVETLELSLNGSFALVLTEKQKTKVRDAVESLRSLHQRKPGVPIESRRF